MCPNGGQGAGSLWNQALGAAIGSLPTKLSTFPVDSWGKLARGKHLAAGVEAGRCSGAGPVRRPVSARERSAERIRRAGRAPDSARR